MLFSVPALLLCIFQLPLRIKKTTICTPKTTAPAASEAAKFSMLWFDFNWADPAPELDVGDGAACELDMLCEVASCDGEVWGPYLEGHSHRRGS